MKVGSLVRLKIQFEHEAGWHSMLGVVLRMPKYQTRIRMDASRCLVHWTDGRQSKPKLEALEIIEEPKKVKKD